MTKSSIISWCNKIKSILRQYTSIKPQFNKIRASQETIRLDYMDIQINNGLYTYISNKCKIFWNGKLQSIKCYYIAVWNCQHTNTAWKHQPHVGRNRAAYAAGSIPNRTEFEKLKNQNHKKKKKTKPNWRTNQTKPQFRTFSFEAEMMPSPKIQTSKSKPKPIKTKKTQNHRESM